MFHVLHSLRYCAASSALLGPVVRASLRGGDLEGAVREFVNLADEYKRTPLKHELLCEILHAMGDGKSEDIFVVNEKSSGKLSKLARTILDVNRRVHGASDVQLTLIAALADVGYKKTLRKLLLDPTTKFHPDALLRRCERFADEKKINALEIIADNTRDLRNINISEIYNMILDVHQRDDNCEEALSLFYKMRENDIVPSQKFIRNLCSFLKANNKEIPSDLVLLLDKHTKIVSRTAT